MYCSVYYININEISNHFTLIVFWCEGHDLYYVVNIAKVLFSHVKISSFCVKAHPVFHWCLYNIVKYQFDFHAGGG